MGIESEQFVHPERIPQELYCPICTLVLDNPVQTPSEHLFCEDELLEWLTRSDKCPVTKERLNPDDITTPGRIIVNMLGNLQRFCPNKEHGCDWSGDNSAVNGSFFPRVNVYIYIHIDHASFFSLLPVCFEVCTF